MSALPASVFPCRVCGKEGKKLCSKCGCARYCSADCQKKDWSEHKKICSPQSFSIERYKEISKREQEHVRNFGYNFLNSKNQTKDLKKLSDFKHVKPTRVGDKKMDYEKMIIRTCVCDDLINAGAKKLFDAINKRWKTFFNQIKTRMMKRPFGKDDDEVICANCITSENVPNLPINKHMSMMFSMGIAFFRFIRFPDIIFQTFYECDHNKPYYFPFKGKDVNFTFRDSNIFFDNRKNKTSVGIFTILCSPIENILFVLDSQTGEIRDPGDYVCLNSEYFISFVGDELVDFIKNNRHLE